MLLHCPHLAQARLQYRSTFGQHLGMKAMFTNPACTPSLASFVHHHVAFPLMVETTNALLLSMAVPGHHDLDLSSSLASPDFTAKHLASID